MKTIHKFFEENSGQEFIQIEKAFPTDEDRVRYRNYFQEICGRQTACYQKVFDLFQRILVKLQKTLHFKRNEDIMLYRGTNWFSLTDECVRFILQNEEWIESRIKYCRCGDELFLQTLLWNNGFQDKLFDSYKEIDGRIIYGRLFRLQDWNRGTPYIWKYEDFKEIKNDSENLFARKFDAKVDSAIISEIKELLK